MVYTRPKNKGAHPGLVDLQANQHREVTRSESDENRPKKDAVAKIDAVAKVNALEATLLEQKRERLAGARELLGPTGVKQPTRPSRPISSRASRQAGANGTYTLSFLHCHNNTAQ